MKRSLPFRAWYYFRTGYATYLTFIMATVNTMVTTYYLAIQKVPALQGVFPTFTIWVIFIVLTVTPLAVFIGWLHLKRSPAFRSEMDITMEANPYYYKLPPGYWREALAPTMLELLRLNLKVISKEPLTEAEISSLKNLQNKLQILIEGGFVGEPRKMFSQGPPTKAPPQE
jgi:hypothetical protein